jgi:hypothetical protein
MATIDKSGYTYASYDDDPDPSHRPMYFSKVVKHLSQFRARTPYLWSGMLMIFQKPL